MSNCFQNKIPECNALNPNKPTVLIYNDITHDTVWTSDKNWVIMNRINVINNSVLAVEEGTIIYANSPDYSDPRNPPSLIVTIGSKLFAEGSCKCPIIFTSILPNCQIFALNNKKNWTFNGGLGPFSALWSGIYVCGNNVTNTTLVTGSYPINLEGTSVTYGGNIINNNNCVLSYVRIYFAGDSSLTNSNSLTLAAPSYNCIIQNLEILYGQGNGISIYGGSALVKDSVIGFKYKGNNVALKDGAYVSLVQNIYIDGYSSVNVGYEADVRAFVAIESVSNVEIDVVRNSVANLCASTFLSLGFIKYHVYSYNYGVFKSVNNAHIGPCTCVYYVPDDVITPYTFTTVCPTTFVQTEFYLGPIGYEQCSGELFCGPAETLQNAYNESGQLLRKITYLTNGYNNDLLTYGKFLNIAPVPTSDLYKSISGDTANSHVLPFLCTGFYEGDVNLNFGLLSCKKSFHASGVVETESNEEYWCTGMFGRFLTICNEHTYNCCFQHFKPCTRVDDFVQFNHPDRQLPCEACPTPCPPPHPHHEPSHSSHSSHSSSSCSLDSKHMDYPNEVNEENKMSDMITKGLVVANAAVMGYFLLKTMNKASKKF